MLKARALEAQESTSEAIAAYRKVAEDINTPEGGEAQEAAPAVTTFTPPVVADSVNPVFPVLAVLAILAVGFVLYLILSLDANLFDLAAWPLPR